MLQFDGNNNLLTVSPRTLAQAGFTFMAGTGLGGAVATSPVRPLAASTSGRLEIATISPLFTDTFNYAAQDTGRWSVGLTTFTNTYATGYCILNGGAVTTASAVAVMKSYWTHPLPTEGAIVIRMFVMLTQVPQANNVVELGSFPLVPLSLAAVPDGVLFRYDATGVLKGVTNYNGTELMTAALTAPSAGVNHSYEIVIDGAHTEFWIDGVFQASIVSPPGQGQPMMSPYVQPTIRTYNAATPPALAQQVKFSDIDVWQTDGNPGRSSVFYRAEQGQMGYQGMGGQTMGQTANYANAAAATAGVPAVGAAIITGLGGQVSETCTIAVNVDGILCSFLNPVATVGIPGRKLIITGVRISSCVTTLLAGGPFVNQYCLNFGHTAISLATAEGAAAKGPRRIPLGIQTWAAAAAVGTKGQDINVQFASPVVVNPGEYVAVSTKNAGTLGTAGNITHMIAFDAHWA